MSALKSSGYGDGRTEGAMPRGDFMWPEHNGKLASGIVVDGVGYQLAGQPPVAQSHGWGDMGWLVLGASHGGIPVVGG
jgi:hypothetical protein